MPYVRGDAVVISAGRCDVIQSASEESSSSYDLAGALLQFKNGKPFETPLPIHRQSCYMFGRERRIADVPTDHPSCSKQQAVIQFRSVTRATAL